MNLWTAIVLIVLAGSAVEVLRIISKRSTKKEDPEMKRQLEELTERVKKQERRIANLETLILDQQKEQPFNNLS